MSTLEASQSQRRVLRPRRQAVPATDGQLAAVNRMVWQLPVVLSGRWSAATPLGNADAALRLQAALWELASHHGVRVVADDTTAEVADALSSRGALSHSAAAAARILAEALAVDGFDELACRLAGRLVAHLELRARYG